MTWREAAKVVTKTPERPTVIVVRTRRAEVTTGESGTIQQWQII
jgi:hypothetical protein